MIRFFIYYFFVVMYRCIRLFYRAPINGDTNFLSSPILTVRRIMSHPSVVNKPYWVDVGCGEGLVAMFMRLIEGKHVFCCDRQMDYLKMIQFMSLILGVSKVKVSPSLPVFDHPDVVYFCVWTSWSTTNRRHMIHQLVSHIPKGGILITVSHGIVHDEFIEFNKNTERFAWGYATVYYYKHA